MYFQVSFANFRSPLINLPHMTPHNLQSLIKKFFQWPLLIVLLFGIGEICFYLVYKYVPPSEKARDEAIFMYRHHL